MTTRTEVVVKDVEIPFGSMIVLILKWTLASIPAMILLAILATIGASVFAGLFGTLIGA